jgi:hypothetical protein
MAICGRCGQRESAGDDCPYCTEYASATAPVGAYSGSAARATQDATAKHGSRRLGRYGPSDYDGHSQYGQAEPEFAALPPCERPFAAERTVWPAAPRLVPTPVDLGPLDDDLAISEHTERDPQLVDGGQPVADLQRRTAVEAPEDALDRALERLELASLTGHGRWIALTTAILVVLIAAAGAVTLVVQHGRASPSAGRGQPSAAASRPVSAPASGVPAGENHLIVAPAAASAPNEAAVVAFLDRYFDAVNDHDFAVYKRLFILALRPRLSPASFSAGFGTTTDSSEQLHSISVIGAAEVDASVTFIDRQTDAASPAASTCTASTVELYLGWRHTRYLLIAAPMRYQASDSGCS